MDFGFQPDETVALPIINRSRYGETIQKFDIAGFPVDRIGAYVIRHVGKVYQRLRGESSILKIGSATKNFRERFQTHNAKLDPIVREHDELGQLAKALIDRSYGNKAAFRQMWLLMNLAKIAPIEVDLYYCGCPEDRENEFAIMYLDRHWEFPPLDAALPAIKRKADDEFGTTY